jgi:2-polyprenyl-3-methyl-5-hydroxy-6-metoxy-1,4-benzoquinol methylase
MKLTDINLKKHGIRHKCMWVNDIYFSIIPGPDKKEVHTKDDVYDFWISRTDGVEYIDHPKRSQLILDLIHDIIRPAKPDGILWLKILEIGCNVGRNLAHIANQKYCLGELSGIEINPYTIHRMRKEYPNLKNMQVYCGSVEKCIKEIPKQDIIFGMAIFEHIHPDSEWVFKEIQKKCKYLISVSDETTKSKIHFKRDFSKVFDNQIL